MNKALPSSAKYGDSVDPLLEVIRSVFEVRGAWPSRQYVQAVLLQDYGIDLDETLLSTKPGFLRGETHRRDSKLMLTVPGLHAAGAFEEVKRFVEMLRWCVDEVSGFRPAEPGVAEDLEISSDRLRDEWHQRGRNTSDLDLTKLLELVRIEGIFDSLHGEGPHWSMTLSYDRLRRFRDVQNVDDYLRHAAERQGEFRPSPRALEQPATDEIEPAPAALPPLDPELREAAVHLFDHGHYSHAVHEGTKFLRDLIREFSGLSEDGDSLAGKAFGTKNPPIRIADLSDPTGLSTQRGAMFLTKGIFAAIRNPLAHDRRELDSVTAAEMLSVLNLVVGMIRKRQT